MKYTLQHSKKDNDMKKSIGLVFMALAVAALLIAAPLSAAWSDRVQGDREGQEDGQNPLLMRIYVTIAVKTKTHLITDGGDRWQIAKNPLIVGTNGKQVRLRDMPVPCEAEILYYSRDNGREVYRVEIKEVSPGAQRTFTSAQPE